MATQFNWVINQLDTAPMADGLTDVVIVVHWTRTAEQYVGGEPILVSNYGTMGCTTPSATDFTAYPDLTQAQVENWLENGLDVPTIDANLQKQIDNIINPPVVVLPLPWLPEPTTTTTTTTTTTEAPIVTNP